MKQLEQSNLELEKTISELKNTQSQLVQSEKMAALLTEEYLSNRGSRKKFDRVLSKIRDVEPGDTDAL